MGTFGVGTKSIDNFTTKLLPQRTTCISIFFPRQLPICVATGLERYHSARKVGIGPVDIDH